jgi:tetratricopeptide (TPR) repeat protein
VQLNHARVHQLLDSSERVTLPTGRSPLVEAWRSHGRACWQFLHAGNIGQFVRSNQDALAHSELVGDVRNANARRHDIGYGYLLLGLYAEAEHELLASLAAAERMGLAGTMALAQHNLGLVLARRGDFDGAIRYEQSAIEAFEAQGDRRYGLGAHMYLARILLLAGNLNGAEREARLAETTDEGDLFAYAGIILASVQLARGDARGALGHVHRTLTRASSVELTLEDEAHLYLVEAEALHAAGEADAARAAIIRASDYLLERADKIEIPEWRESFLWRVPENARTLKLARAWRVSGERLG